ncbi:hypothetical protein HUJ04_007510 [Dendroctonus ponderosae]|nr:hypothetical protein HUJ04_007510 [Dendroctonus ponderosae]
MRLGESGYFLANEINSIRGLEVKTLSLALKPTIVCLLYSWYLLLEVEVLLLVVESGTTCSMPLIRGYLQLSIPIVE